MNVHPTVYSLVFGESVLNDAVAIVLFRYRELKVDQADLLMDSLAKVH